MDKLRILCVGDVHGCVEELRDLLALAEYNPEKDRLVFLGDLVDRGPDSLGVVRMVREELRAECVKGNHDEKPPRWRRHQANEKLHGKPNPMKRPDAKRIAEWESLSEDDIRWLDGLPWFIDLVPEAGWVGVHAGFEPARWRHEQHGDRMCRIRYAGSNGLMAPTQYVGHVPEGSVPWTTWSGKWLAPTNVVYGHAVHDTAFPRIDKLGSLGMLYGIDTGCCFGGRLSVWIYKRPGVVEVVSVPARATYADLKMAGSE